MRRKIIPLILLLGLSSLANAKDSGHGTVNMEGSIIDSACAVDTKSRYQVVDMHSQPLSEMISDGRAYDYPFSIHLINCSLVHAGHQTESWQAFQVTFDGKVDGDNFGLDGDAEGISLQIHDDGGNVSHPGIAMPARSLKPGDMTLNYTMSLISNDKGLKSGSFHTTVRYKLDYY
ncbi:fimbrial protein [Scandinavium goeteborgense]|uniref:fimbrial protein n=1 Tax=Scandinavium goeteborgense TaxID=1851514 RepID=UPI000F68AF7C|nr:fimbrial protein [Scandinavium goeteborgense]QKN79770.1 type 1 fimbrial protein [Scandinavium goeteborgense]